jgi:hypothetical protein
MTVRRLPPFVTQHFDPRPSGGDIAARRLRARTFLISDLLRVMVAFDSRRTPDPSQLLHPETVGALRTALAAQRASRGDASPELSDAIRAAADEARARELPPEALLIQLKQLADDVGLSPDDPEAAKPRRIREWMVGALLRAYWASHENPESAEPA